MKSCRVVAVVLVAALAACAGERSVALDAVTPVGDGQPRRDLTVDGAPADAPRLDAPADGPRVDSRVDAPGTDSSADASVDAPPAPTFSDVPSNHPHRDGIGWVEAKGIMQGCGGGKFCPDDALTRAQAAVTLVVARHGQSFSYTQTPYFADVPVSHWAFKYIQKLRDMNITQGCGSGNYCPDVATTRAQGAVFLVRVKFGNSFSTTQTPYFADVPATHLSFKYIQKLRQENITLGCGSGNYCPDADLLRAHWATMLYRAQP